MPDQAPLRIVPLGGLGEFGLNCTVFERGDEAIVVDCGVMFPEDHMLGIDLVIPDLSYVKSLGDRFKAFVLTHGHEDHQGALPHVLADFDVPVYATPFTAGLVSRKLEEHPKLAGQRVEIYEPGEPFDVGGFTIEGIHVTHSIVDACSLAIRTGGETVIHTGDFKLDKTPVDGRPTDYARFRELGDEGVRLLLSDSTNVERPGDSGSEKSVRGYLEPIFRETEGRIILTTFASHIHRLAAVISLCEEFGRKLVIRGRSLEANVSLATRTGHLRIPGDMIMSMKDAAGMPAGDVCYIVTGSQGEPRSALARIAMHELKEIAPCPGDAVIFSSKVIPGNERPISEIIDRLFQAGAEVYYPQSMKLHESGHGYSGELREMLEMVRPEYFLPVHGQYRNLVYHGRLAVETGVDPEKCFRMTNGDVLELDGDGARVAGSVETGRVLVDGTVVGGIDDQVIRDRRHISKDGLVLVVLGVSHQTGEILSGPELVARGLVSRDGQDVDLEGARQAVVDQVKSMTLSAISDRDELQEEVRRAVRRYLRRLTGNRPVVVPYILEL